MWGAHMSKSVHGTIMSNRDLVTTTNDDVFIASIVI